MPVIGLVQILTAALGCNLFPAELNTIADMPESPNTQKGYSSISRIYLRELRKTAAFTED
jgi:hypothetical protein